VTLSRGVHLYQDGHHRLTVRIEVELSLDDMASALIREVCVDRDPDARPAAMSAKEVLSAVREAQATYGDTVWMWSDRTDSVTAEEWREWARGIIVAHWPELAISPPRA
jgi:hypothetical protein